MGDISKLKKAPKVTRSVYLRRKQVYKPNREDLPRHAGYEHHLQIPHAVLVSDHVQNVWRCIGVY